MFYKFYKQNFKHNIDDKIYDYVDNEYDRIFIKKLETKSNYIKLTNWESYKEVLSYYILYQLINKNKLLIIFDGLNSRSWLFKHVLDAFVELQDKYQLYSSYKKYKYNIFELLFKGSATFMTELKDDLDTDYDLIINIGNNTYEFEKYLKEEFIENEIYLEKLTIINNYFRTNISGIKLEKLERFTNNIIKYDNPFDEFNQIEEMFKNINKD